MVEFFSKLMGLWNELENTIKRPTCTCEAASKYAKMVEQDWVDQFLMGLDDDLYSNIRSHIHILALDPLLSLDKIFSMVQQEENHKKAMNEWDHKYDAAAFAVTHYNKGGQFGGDRLSFCSGTTFIGRMSDLVYLFEESSCGHI